MHLLEYYQSNKLSIDKIELLILLKLIIQFCQ